VNCSRKQIQFYYFTEVCIETFKEIEDYIELDKFLSPDSGLLSDDELTLRFEGWTASHSKDLSNSPLKNPAQLTIDYFDASYSPEIIRFAHQWTVENAAQLRDQQVDDNVVRSSLPFGHSNYPQLNLCIRWNSNSQGLYIERTPFLPGQRMCFPILIKRSLLDKHGREITKSPGKQ